MLLSIPLYMAYDEMLSLHCVKLAQATYTISSASQWDCITCESSIELNYVIEKNSIRVLQGYDSYTNTIFTAFRGSVDIQNWIDNIKISHITPYDNSSIAVEKGFYTDYNIVKSDIYINLKELTKKYNMNKLLITGHSLGGALSTLMTYDINLLFPEYSVLYLVNLGSPRVGNKAFAESFNKYAVSITYYRITHYFDIVPHVPEEFLDYLHISNEIWYNEINDNYKICDDEYSEDNTCSNSCSPMHCTSTSDHLNYLNVSMGSQ